MGAPMEGQQGSFFASLDNARRGVNRFVICIVCKSGMVNWSKNSQGKVYCRCRCCGIRFWLN